MVKARKKSRPLQCYAIGVRDDMRLGWCEAKAKANGEEKVGKISGPVGGHGEVDGAEEEAEEAGERHGVEPR